MLGIKDIHGDHLAESSLVFTVDLPVARQSGGRVDSFLLPRFVTFKFVWQAWTWPHQTHVSSNNIEELRQFVQTRSTQQTPQGYQPRITSFIELCHWRIVSDQVCEMSLMSLGFRIHFHASKLEDHEEPSAMTHALLSVENGSWRSDLNQKHDQNHDRQPERKTYGHQTQIKDAFPRGKLRTTLVRSVRLRSALIANEHPRSGRPVSVRGTSI